MEPYIHNFISVAGEVEDRGVLQPGGRSQQGRQGYVKGKPCIKEIMDPAFNTDP